MKKEREKQNMLQDGTSLAVQWLRFCTSTAEGVGSIPGQGSKILHVSQHGKKKKKMLQDVKVWQVCSKTCNERGQNKTGTEAGPIHLGFMPGCESGFAAKVDGKSMTIKNKSGSSLALQ